MDPLFEVHVLNEHGLRKAREIAKAFNGLMEELYTLCPQPNREMSIVWTHLEEGCFYAKKAMANDPANQQTAEGSTAASAGA